MQVSWTNTEKPYCATISTLIFLPMQEAFDYIGSSRMVYEMKKNRFPYNIDPEEKEGPAKVGLKNLDVSLKFVNNKGIHLVY